VAFEKAPFDHPELFIPHGSPQGHPEQDLCIDVPGPKNFCIDIPAVGQAGRTTELPTFLNLDPQQP
jgi:hypothetical protein